MYSPYGYPPPMWPPGPQQNTIDQNTFEKGIQIALKIQQREAREKERLENRVKRAKDDDRKEAAAARSRALTSIEWFIIGVISYPIVGPLYNLAIHRLSQ